MRINVEANIKILTNILSFVCSESVARNATGADRRRRVPLQLLLRHHGAGDPLGGGQAEDRTVQLCHSQSVPLRWHQRDGAAEAWSGDGGADAAALVRQGVRHLQYTVHGYLRAGAVQPDAWRK